MAELLSEEKLHSCQLSRNVWDSPGFTSLVPCPTLLMLKSGHQLLRPSQVTDDASTWVWEYIELALSLILFFITWGFGIPATHRHNIGIARIIFQAIFITGSFLLGITVFLFFCLLSREVRQTWTALVSKVCRLPGQ